MEALIQSIKDLKNTCIIGIISPRTNQVYLVKPDGNELSIETYSISKDPLDTTFLTLKDTKNINPGIVPAGTDLIESLYILGVKALLKGILYTAQYPSIQDRLAELVAAPDTSCPVLSYDSTTDTFSQL